MIVHNEIEDIDLHSRIRRREVQYAGNKKLKIYGTLQCAQGKRMKRANRVFFASAGEAIAHGYRPCGHCMRQAYNNWKNGTILLPH